DDDLADSVAAEAMLRLPRCPIVVGRLADWQQAALLHSGVKLTVPAPADLLSECVERLESLVRSPLLEVQERAVSCHSLLRGGGGGCASLRSGLAGRSVRADRATGAGGAGSQRQVHPPDGLDLEAWINAPLACDGLSERKKKKKTKQKRQAAANPVPAPELRDSAD
uniref:Rubis-subs-bind domain-containing protein n=1 Tax=Macrostomum lignano TaxID=282301 RepID=A0A1I8FCG4_9PLAT